MENVLKAKFELVNGEKNDFVTILNGDNELIKENSQNMQNVIYYGFNKQNTYNAQNIEINQDQTSFDLYYYDNKKNGEVDYLIDDYLQVMQLQYL